MEGPDAPAAQQSPRVPVTTRPEVPRKQRKEKNKRLYGAKRTASGKQLQRAPEKKFAVVSPDTIVQFRKAVDIFTYGVDANTGRPADRDVVEGAVETVEQLQERARGQAEEGERSEIDVLVRTVNDSISTAQELSETDPERAGGVLAYTKILVDGAQRTLPLGQRDDARLPELAATLTRTFSGITPGKTGLTPNKATGTSSRRTSSTRSTPSSTQKALFGDSDGSASDGSVSDDSDNDLPAFTTSDEVGPFDDESDDQSAAAAAPGVASQFASAVASGVSGVSNLLYSRTQETSAPQRQSPAASVASEDEFHDTRGTPASSVHSGSPHLSAVVSGENNPRATPEELRREQLRAVREIVTQPVPDWRQIQLQQQRQQAGVDADEAAAANVQPQLNVAPQEMQARVNIAPGGRPAAAAAAAPRAGVAAAPPRAAAAAAPVPPAQPGAPIAGEIRRAIERSTRENLVASNALRDSVNRIGEQQELTPAQMTAALTNLEGGPNGNPPAAPLTAQLFAQGRLTARQLIVPAEVQAYENALRQRRVSKDTDGTTQKTFNARLSAQPVLTRYVEDTEVKGARRYRQPRFAGPAY